jgi:hypothetical protein
MYICLLGLIVRFILVFLALFVQFDHSSNDANKYFEDGQENHNKTKKFITGYIAEDIEICNSM